MTVRVTVSSRARASLLSGLWGVMAKTAPSGATSLLRRRVSLEAAGLTVAQRLVLSEPLSRSREDQGPPLPVALGSGGRLH